MAPFIHLCKPLPLIGVTKQNKYMAVDLRCPNCYDNLGKDTENPKLAFCGTCGEDDIRNPRGYDDDDE